MLFRSVSQSRYGFVNDSYRLCRACKLLMSLGYGNFTTLLQYDIYAMAEKYVRDGHSWSRSGFDSDTSYSVYKNANVSITNSPNLSILPLLAYHKICNDHYRNEKWQPFEPWTCNIDYLSPLGSMNAKTFISSSTFTSILTSIIDLENSNLPIDYLRQFFHVLSMVTSLRFLLVLINLMQL